MLSRIFVCFLFIFISGCSSSYNTSHIMVGKARTPISPTEVQVYLTPPAKYEEIAIVNGTNAWAPAISEQSKVDYIVTNLKEQAAKLGANGIILNQFSDQEVNTPITSYNVEGQATVTNVSGLLKKGSGLAIYVQR